MARPATSVLAKTLKPMKIKQGSPVVAFLIYLFIGTISAITLFPFIYIISASFSDPYEIAAGNVWFLPVGFSTKSYAQVFSSRTIIRSFFNSVFFTTIITFLNVANSMLAGHALNKKGLVFRKSIVLYILIPMYFSGGLIPGFIIISKLGLYNTLGAIILPSIVGIWNIILARTYISGLPDSLKEAAIVDGASEMQLFTRIILPLSKPMMAVLALYTALAAWNAWFNYMIFLPKLTEWHPLQIFLTKVLIWGNMQSVLQAGDNVDPEVLKNKMLMAVIGGQLKYTVMVVTTLPIIMIYPLVQKHFIKGALLGSLKE